jgi:hypothetical protein
MAVRRRTLHDYTPLDDDEEESVDEPAAPAWFAVARGAALSLGCFILLNLLAEMRFPHFSSSAWLVDLHPLPKGVARGWLGLTGILLVGFCIFPRMNAAARRLATLCTFGLFGAALWNAWRFYHAWQHGEIHAQLPIPFALHVAATSAVVLPGLLSEWERFNLMKDVIFGWGTVGVCVVGFALAQFFCIGKTDDRCKSEAVLVFFDSGEAEIAPQAAAARVRAGCDIYRAGQVRKLLLIGHTAESPEKGCSALHDLAVGQGLPGDDVVDVPGEPALEGTVAAAAKLLQQHSVTHVLIAAPFYLLRTGGPGDAYDRDSR